MVKMLALVLPSLHDALDCCVMCPLIDVLPAVCMRPSLGMLSTRNNTYLASSMLFDAPALAEQPVSSKILWRIW